MENRNESGFSLIELLIVVAIIAIIAAIAIPGLLRARMSGNEASAIGSLRTIVSSQQTYASSAGGGFAVSLVRLGTPCPNSAEGFVSADLGQADTVQKSGFTIAMVAGAGNVVMQTTDCNGVQANSNYYATAQPTAVGTSGTRAFATNGGALWQDTSGTPPTEPFTLAGTVSPAQ